MPQRDPDQVFSGVSSEPPYFEDLTERCALKLTSLLRLTGRPHYGVWAERVGGLRFREETGQFIPIFFMDLEVLDVPIETRASLSVAVDIRLAREDAADGSIRRLVSEGRTRILAPSAGGGHLVGRTRKLAVFAHLDHRKGRVTGLHPSLGLGEAPSRRIVVPRLADLLRPPEGHRAEGDGWTHSDYEPQVWSYQQTDPNGHIHAMEYLRMLELFAAAALAREGRLRNEYVFCRARVCFSRPCYAGERYVRRGTFWRAAREGGADLFCGAIFKCDAAGRVADDEQPATVVWLIALSLEEARRPGSEAW